MFAWWAGNIEDDTDSEESSLFESLISNPFAFSACVTLSVDVSYQMQTHPLTKYTTCASISSFSFFYFVVN